MEPGQRSAPSRAELQAYSLGKIDAHRAAEIESFLAQNPDCGAILDAAPDDDLVRHLRGAGDLPTLTSGLTEAETLAPEPPLREAEPRLHAMPGETAADAHTDSSGESALTNLPRYQLLRKLGEGGMGAVFLAEHRVMRRQVAVKLIRAASLANPQAVERFRREVTAAARLSHPNIVTAYDAEEAGGIHFLAMEYVEGDSLWNWLAEHGPLPVAEACAYVRQAALGLQYAHERGMVHRDLKPHNLMRTPDGTIKILDFGLARFACESEGVTRGQLTADGAVMGTPDYMAPEQAQDSRTADIRADIYSLGCTLYQLLADRLPFPDGTAIDKIIHHSVDQPEPLGKLRTDLPAELVQVVEKMMAKGPADRYQTPAEVAAALEPFTRGAATARRRRWLPLAIAAGLLFAIIVAGAVYRIQTDRGELIITTESDDVEVVIKQGGKLVRIIDTKNQKSITLRSGVYDLKLKDAKGLELDINEATLTRDKQVLARIKRVPIGTNKAIADATMAVPPVSDSSAAASAAAEIRVFRGHGGPVTNLALSPDAKTLVSVSEDWTAIVWDVETGAIRHRLRGSPDILWAVQISPDGKFIVAGGQDEQSPKKKKDFRIRVWDVQSGALVRALAGHTAGHNGFEFLDNTRFVSGNEDGTVRFWSVATDQEWREPIRLRQGISAIAPDPSAKRIAIGTDKGDVVVREFDGKDAPLKFPVFADQVYKIIWMSDHELAVAGLDMQPALIDLTTKNVRRLVGHTENAAAMGMLSGGQFVVTGDENGTVRLWSVADARDLAMFNAGCGDIPYLKVLPDDRHVIVAGQDGTLRWWRLPSLDVGQAVAEQPPTTIGPRANGSLLFKDDFTERTPLAIPLIGGTTTFKQFDGVGYLTGTTTGLLPVIYPQVKAKDLIVECECLPAPFPKSRQYGLVFRSSEAKDGVLASYYAVVVAPGQQKISMVLWHNATWTTLKEVAVAPALVTRDAPHTLRVEAVVADFRIFIDGRLVLQLVDNSLDGPGTIGLHVYAPNDVRENTVEFRNLRVWNVSE